MVNLGKLLNDGVILSILAAIYLFVLLRINPRLLLGDYPKEIQDRVPPKTDQEKRLSLWFGIPFLVLLAGVPFLSTWDLARSAGQVNFLTLFFNAAGVAFIFNLFDLLVIDWLVFCFLTPAFLVLPGTSGLPAYKDYGFHFRGFLVGTFFSIILGLVIAGLVWLLGVI